MMKRVCLLTLAVCLFVGCACAQSLTGNDAALLTSTGSAVVELPADYALLTLHLRGTGETVDEAQAAADALHVRLMEMLLAAGAVQQDIQTAHWDVEVLYQYHYTKLSETQLPVGYNTTTAMEVMVPDVDKAGALVAAAAIDGVTYELTFHSTRTKTAYTQALASAVQDAMTKAEQLAQSCGLTLDALVSVTEMPAYMEEGALTVTAAVEVAYRVK